MQLWMIQYQNIPTMQNLIQFCATVTCNAAPPHVPAVVANQQRKVQQRPFLFHRWKSTIIQGATTRRRNKKEEDNNSIHNSRRSNSVDYEEEDLLKVKKKTLPKKQTTFERNSLIALGGVFDV